MTTGDATFALAAVRASVTLPRILATHRAALGHDFAGYFNHVCRVASLCVAQVQTVGGADLATAVEPATVEKIAVAAACHDLGIWTDRTFDYLRPSARLAHGILADSGHRDWIPEVTQMILQHHKLTPYRGPDRALVEPFRRADWIDVSAGVLTFGMPSAVVKAILGAWPNAGFHRRLVLLQLTRFRTHPLNPLPMVRL